MDAGLSTLHWFSPMKDYLGLAKLVGRVEQPQDDYEDLYSSSIWPTRGGGDVMTEFRRNGTESMVERLDSLYRDDVFRPLNSEEDASRRIMRKQRATVWCVFCKNNGERESVYSSHILKDQDGKTLCPILRAYTCPLCGVNGDHAHTLKYCPTKRNELPPAPLKTPRTSTGRKRQYCL
ncbi:nanos homolog 1-like [Asterias amurensis]|uniref:nanos homolog 1-like n=1 Tax=Asterias amurensis TaxID=7602 RepID=UPI003AB323BF